MLKINDITLVRSENRTDEGSFGIITILLFTLIILNLLNTFHFTTGGIEYVHKLWNPSLLLLGPLVFASFCNLERKRIWTDSKNLLHLVPCMMLALVVLYIVLFFKDNDPKRSAIVFYYQNSYFLIILSLLSYSIHTLIKMGKVRDIKNSNAETLITLICSVFIIISLVMIIIYPAKVMFHLNLGIDYRYFAYGLLLIICIAIIRYWIISRIISSFNGVVPYKLNDEVQKGYKNSTISAAKVEAFKAEIVNYFENNKGYLDSNLSLIQLSKVLNISVHNLSQIFNIHFEKKFYNFVAEYRIKYAIGIMENDLSRLTIESIAYTCGFNSKTSFNYYFKIITGITPHQYRTELDGNKSIKNDALSNNKVTTY